MYVKNIKKDEDIQELSKSILDIQKYYSPVNNNVIDEIQQLNKSIIINNEGNNNNKSIDTNSSIESLCPKDTNIYLKLYEWDKYLIDEKNMNKIILELMSNNEIIEFKKNLENLNLTSPDCDEVILFSNIGYLSKYQNEYEICTTKRNCKNLFFRKIKGDGNCYYRSIMFSLIENLILNKDIIFFKKIFGNFLEKSKNKILITMLQGLDINIELFKKCFIMIYLSLTSKSRNPELKTYIVFFKLINNYKDFDYGLIIFFKFILYEYININKKSTYSFKFQILLGNLLPNECQKDNGDFDYNLFYKKYLMKFYQYAEKIIIYLTPFIFGNEIYIEYLDDSNTQNIEFGNNLSIIDFDKKNRINLLYKNSHYDVLYTKEYFEKNKNIVKITLLNFINNFRKNFCQICKINNEENSILIKLESDNKSNKDNISIKDFEIKNSKNIIICYKCLFKEIKYNLKILYINCIQKAKKYFLNNITEKINDLLLNKFSLSNNIFQISINQAINFLSLYRNKYTFEYILNIIKQEICIFCTKNIEKNKFVIILPCKCLLCSDKCIREFYYILMSSLYIKKDFSCFCNIKYSIKYYLLLIEKYNEKKFDCKELIDFLFNKIFKDICFLCEKKTIGNDKEYLFIEPNFCLNRIIKHFICFECDKNNENYVGQNIFCNICGRNHIIEKINEKSMEGNIKGYNFNSVKHNKDEFNKDIDININKKRNKNKENEINFHDSNNIINNEEEKITIIKIKKKKKLNK